MWPKHLSIIFGTTDASNLSLLKYMIEEFSKIKGFLEQKEGKALYEACKFSFKTGKCAEIGSYCGKSACYIGLACKEVGSKLYSVDHHRGSEEQQYGCLLYTSPSPRD